jgi:hypothetical protein
MIKIFKLQNKNRQTSIVTKVFEVFWRNQICYGVTWYIPDCGRYVGRYPFTTCCATGPNPTPSPSLLWRRIFSSQTFSRWLPKLFSNLVIHHLPAYVDGTECSKTSAYKIQTPGNYAKENIQHDTNFREATGSSQLLLETSDRVSWLLPHLPIEQIF